LFDPELFSGRTKVLMALLRHGRKLNVVWMFMFESSEILVLFDNFVPISSEEKISSKIETIFCIIDMKFPLKIDSFLD
jgi:hypothetical protein